MKPLLIEKNHVDAFMAVHASNTDTRGWEAQHYNNWLKHYFTPYKLHAGDIAKYGIDTDTARTVNRLRKLRPGVGFFLRDVEIDMVARPRYEKFYMPEVSA